MTTITKWGNSLAIRIPQNLAKLLQLSEGSKVSISVENGNLIIKPKTRRRYSLDELVKEITPENLHTEIDTGVAVGNETW
jgi:antitoxin MazE